MPSPSSAHPRSCYNVQYDELSSVLLTRKSRLTSAHRQRDPLCSEMLAGCHIPLGNRAQKCRTNRPSLGHREAFEGRELLCFGKYPHVLANSEELCRYQPLHQQTYGIYERQVVLPKRLNQHSMKICVSVFFPAEFPPSKILNFCDLW